MKRFLFLFSALMLLMSNSAYSIDTKDSDEKQVYYLWDFQGGDIPEGFQLFDRDGMSYDSYAIHMGFTKQKPWLWAIEKAGSNNACLACFPYYFRSVGDHQNTVSQDWVVSSAIYVSPKEGKITWKSRSDVQDFGAVKGFKGAYNVYISTKGQDPDDFTEAPVFVMEGDSLDWCEHSVDVSKYHKQTIYVAFANQTIKEEFTGFVYIDDLALVGEKEPFQAESQNEKFLFKSQDVIIKYKVTAATDIPVTQLKAYCSYNGENYSKEMSDVNLKKGEFTLIEFDDKISMNVSDTLRYKVWFEVNEIEYPATEHELICLSFKPERKVLVEEGTGMWCGFCAIGIPAFEEMYEKYPKNFIGIAVHTRDILNCDETYISGLGWKDFPVATINRKYTTQNPMVMQIEDDKSYYTTLAGGLATFLLRELNEDVAAASMALTAQYKDEAQTKIKAKVDYKFAKNCSNADYRIAFVLVENRVTGEGFYQNNSYSAFKGDAGGLEKLPAKLVGLTFHDVAREIYNFGGIEGSIPSEITADEDKNYEYEITIPTKESGPQIKPNNLYVVAMIVDSSTGYIVNADKVYLGDLTNISSERKSGDVVYRLSGGICTVTLTEEYAGNAKVELVDLNGRVLVSNEMNCDNSKEISIPVNNSKGICLLRLTSENKTTVFKIMVD